MLQINQLSVIVRYVVLDDDNYTVKESFLGFIPMNSCLAESVANTAVTKLEELGITLEKLRAQVSSICRSNDVTLTVQPRFTLANIYRI